MMILRSELGIPELLENLDFQLSMNYCDVSLISLKMEILARKLVIFLLSSAYN